MKYIPTILLIGLVIALFCMAQVTPEHIGGFTRESIQPLVFPAHATNYSVRWLNEEAHQELLRRNAEEVKAEAEWAKAYAEFNATNKSPQIIMMRSSVQNYYHGIDTNHCYEIGQGTNRHRVELGFRDDGVVVWRKMK